MSALAFGRLVVGNHQNLTFPFFSLVLMIYYMLFFRFGLKNRDFFFLVWVKKKKKMVFPVFLDLFWVTQSWNTRQHVPSKITDQRLLLALRSVNTGLLGQRLLDSRSKVGVSWSFLGGSRVVFRREVGRTINNRKGSSLSASWLTSSQIASNAFTLGTVAVLPFYTLMVLAPKAEVTKRTMETCIPYVMLGMLYGYLLYLSWTPETMQAMFASKYWLPELSGILKMFSNEMTMASAWIHLLAVDLFAARQVFHDGLQNKIETRHSVSLCLLFCPIGIATHAITKVLTKTANRGH